MVIPGTESSGVAKPHVALSFVSSGTRFNVNDETAVSMNALVIGKGSKSESVVYSRFSNDKYKYKVAMESMKEFMLWADSVSLPQNVPDPMIMVEIGHAYSAALHTVAVLENSDASILQKIVSMINYTMDGTSAVGNYGPFGKRVSLLNSMSELSVCDAEHIMGRAKNISNDIKAEVDKKGQYSYWSRAWTMQEQHQSSTVDYSVVIGDTLSMIVSSSELLVWCRIVCHAADTHRTAGAHDDNLGVTQVLYVLMMFLTGVQRQNLSTRMGLPEDMDTLLIVDIINNPRCARNKTEMNTALCIALGVPVSDEKGQWSRIIGILVSKGFMPVKKRYGVFQNRGWLPERSSTYRSAMSMYCSAEYKCFTRFSTVPEIRVHIDYKGRLVIRSYLVEIALQQQQRAGAGEVHIIGGMQLVDGRSKAVSYADIVVRTRDPMAISVSCEIVCEKWDYDAVTGYLSSGNARALLIGSGNFLVLESRGNKALASIFINMGHKRRWAKFYADSADVGMMATVKLDGVEYGRNKRSAHYYY
jgi:roadblock/LC7 domain-containing protein